MTSARQAAIDFILDHYERPRHPGRLEPADLVVQGRNPGCGDVVTYYLRLDDHQRVTAVAFEGVGCTISQAAASLMTEKVLGRSLAEIADLPLEALLDELGRELVAARLPCASLGFNLLKSARNQHGLLPADDKADDKIEHDDRLSTDSPG